MDEVAEPFGRPGALPDQFEDQLARPFKDGRTGIGRRVLGPACHRLAEGGSL